ncbi:MULTISPECIES: hypothetical protein [Aeromonas]|uniref:hypothetical protein n=1 Tax=Aeromonas TaxID=642 RepID=UPI001F2F009C|nr:MULTISPECIES: hypothetical protein [Aeromonas]MCF5904251.1 hypothetical protein [Aeromonas veronii]
MSIFELNNGECTYIFPAFKFQEKDHARLMLENGNVHLSNISVFRDSSRFSGQILDEKEGIVTLHNSIATSVCDFYEQNNRHAYPEAVEIAVSDVFVFCCTKYFLSDSLTWAISEGKQSCILITDVGEYIRRISSYYESTLEWVEAQECQYIGRDFFATSATPYDPTNYFIQKNMNAAFVKPKEYAAQRELRLIWKPKSSFQPQKFLNNDIETQDLLIPVLFHDFDSSYRSSGRQRVGARIISKSGTSNAEYNISIPNEVFTPVIHTSNNDQMLGFLATSSHLSGGNFKGGQIGILMSAIGPIVCNVYLKDIEYVEIFTKNA